LGVESNNLKVELGQNSAKVTLLFDNFGCLRTYPILPGFSNTIIKLNRVALTPLIYINWVALMIAQSRYHRYLNLLFQQIRQYSSKIQIVGL
jgi:hypothetical protein